MKELQLIGLATDFLGTLLLLLFLDPLSTEKKIENQNGKGEKRIIRKYLMKRHFALFIIGLGFIIQLISLLQ
jgi:hypothetical protein